MTNGWTRGHYVIFRAILGCYLLVHFVQLLPWGAELFSNQGVLPEGTASPLLHLFPNILAVADSPAVVLGLLAAGVVLSALFALGIYDRVAAVGLWYVWACLLGRNPLVSNPSIPYVGWLLLAHALMPGQSKDGKAWQMPPGVFAAAWIVLALGYTYSGWTKLVSPSWRDGTAMARVLENPLARPGPLRDALLALPPTILHIATWSALGLELLFAPLALSRRLRPWLWGIMLAMHLGLMVLIDFADLSLGMVMMHLFTADPGWMRPRREGKEPGMATAGRLCIGGVTGCDLFRPAAAVPIRATG